MTRSCFSSMPIGSLWSSPCPVHSAERAGRSRSTRPRRRPPEAIEEGYFVATIPYAVGQRPELGLYEPNAFVPNVGRGLSLVPDAVRSARDLMLAHYMKYEQVVTDWEPRDRPITRSQMELVASRTSAKNDCFY